MQRREFGARRDRLDDLDQDAVRVRRDEVPLAKILAADITADRQASGLEALVDRIDILLDGLGGLAD